MANIFLTDQCDRGCKFCFAKIGPWSDDYPRRALTMEEVKECLDLKWLGKRKEIGLLGGEPLCYPSLADVIQLIWAADLSPKIFTNGLYPIPEDLASLKIDEDVRFIVNISQWDSYSLNQQKHLDQFLKTFCKHVYLSYTITDPNEDLSFLLEYISKFGLKLSIRMGIALPIAGRSNEYLPQESYREVAISFMEFAQKSAKHTIELQMDCGFVACMFETEEIGLLLSLGMKTKFACEPAMDIGPELEAWHCFPLSKLHRVSLRKYKTLDRVNGRLQELADGLREKFEPGIFKRCGECMYRKRGQCSGGCLGFIVPGEEDLANVTLEI